MINICELFVQDIEAGRAKKIVVRDGEREYNIYKVKDIVRIDIKDIVRIDIKKEGE